MSNGEPIFFRSSKKNESSLTEGDSSTQEDDIWDDTLLVKAYDNAVQLAQKGLWESKQISENETKSKVEKKGGEQKWKVGDKCRCQYSEDLKYYEADVIEIIESSGMCVVRYVGYENEEKVLLKKLKQSAGEIARARQCKQALEEKEDQSSMELGSAAVGGSERRSQPVRKKSCSTKKDKHFQKKNGFNDSSSFPPFNFSLPQIGNAIIPPPPPPHIFNKLEDTSETEAMSAMLISWYMSGYHTGFYQGLKTAKKQ